MKRIFIPLMALWAVFWVACIDLIEPDISTVELQLSQPSDSLYTGREVLDFRWEAEDKIATYRFQLFRQENGMPFLLIDSFLTQTRLRLQLPEGSYEWQLNAENDRSEAAAVTRSFFIDKHPPLIPQAIFPFSGDSLAMDEEWLLNWKSGDQIAWPELYPVRDSVYLYAWQQDWPKLIQSYEISENQPNHIDLSFLSEFSHTEYRWEIRSFDRLGQRSCSQLFQFFIP